MDKLPHCNNLAKRNIVPSSFCACCVGVTEDSEHICRSCPAAQEVWDLIQPGLPHDFFTLPFQEWLVLNCKQNPIPQNATSLHWHILFPHILWALWLRRNDLTISQNQLSASACLDKAKALAWNYSLYHDNSSSLSSSTPSTLISRWTPPASDYWVLNVDGSFISPKEPAAIAGVVRDSMGSWVMGFHRKCYTSNPTMTELQAIYEGLKLIKLEQWFRVIVRSDCTNALNMIADSNTPRSENYNIALACRLLLQEMQEVTLEFAPRKTNMLADNMAKVSRKDNTSRFHTVFVMSPMMELMSLYNEEKPP